MSNKKFAIFTLVGKGGVSKSTTSVWMHQYLSSMGYNVKGYDTDPVNSTFKAFSNLDVTHIDIYNNKNEIDKSLLDVLIEEHLINLPDNGCAVIDNGATSFNAMLGYLRENNIIELLAEYGVDVFISVPLVGGSDYNETCRHLLQLHENFSCPKIIWLNSFFGQFPDDEQNPYDLIPNFLGESLFGMVDIPDLNKDTFGAAIEKMQSLRLTFEECATAPQFKLMERTRIKKFNEDLFNEMAIKLPFKAVKPKKGK